jgi:hypothetical protein
MNARSASVWGATGPVLPRPSGYVAISRAPLLAIEREHVPRRLQVAFQFQYAAVAGGSSYGRWRLSAAGEGSRRVDPRYDQALIDLLIPQRTGPVAPRYARGLAANSA